ncbi:MULTISPECIES: serine hydrolase domain-containing protein [unclassified Sphingopyxis]|uniref:serine hydrolase domain-containing protein n=1 Tax=unclassified Sphingopyxis TaxID=2614943 RepID=UPI00285489A4|nr:MULTISPECIES: serine hydrolase domain-containing protein [unclassified Sphingopyxis]MDR7059363.1 CubicO group peptidase (beta-lactamase class C family) [Sphingopyxis sp. BE235]MDR7178451.1 CubicO group peptidase (beta-lactamase class C family) [Sphingopyxis sp. BE249]
MRFIGSCAALAAAVLAGLMAPPMTGAAAQTAAKPVAETRGGGGLLPAPDMVKSDVDAWLDGYMPYALKRGDAAGAVVVVVKDGKVLTQRGFGYADVGTRRPVDPETTLFKQASVSKLITWTAVMQLVEQGKIDLDRDINAYLDFKIPAFGGKPVTMRNLMTHTGGFDEVQRGLNSYDPKKIPSLGDALKRQVPHRIYAPGTTPAYSNYGTSLAGYIVERVSGLPYDDYVERRIFAPAGMTRSTFRQPLPAALRPLMASGYMLGSGKPGRFELSSLTPSGAMTASGADMGRFMLAHLADGGALMKPATAAQMQGTILRLIPPLNGMALGFYEQNINGRKALSHAGDSLNFHSQLWIFPEENVGIYMSMNAAGTQNVSGPIRSYLFEAFADRYFPFEQRDGRVDAATAREHARMMVGTYNKTRRLESSFLKAMELVGQTKVSLDGDGGIRLNAVPDIGGQPRKWVEIAPFVWREQGGKLRLAAKVEKGRVVRFSVDSASPYIAFDRVPWHLSSAWLTPAMLASLGALLLTAIAWPAAALARRRYGVKADLAPAALKSYRLTRGFAALAVAVMVGWLWFATSLLADFSSLSGELDWALVTLQIATPVIFLGLLASAIWNIRHVWTSKRGRFAKFWSLVLLLSAVVLLWIGVGFHLIGFGTRF